MNGAAHLALFAAALGTGTLALGATGHVQHDEQVNLQESFLDKPHDPATYQTNAQAMSKVLWRENIVVKFKQKLTLEANGYLLAQSFRDHDETDKFVLLASDPRNRSTALEHHFYHTDLRDALWTFDQLDLLAKIGALRVRAGRFPIDLSRTFVFRPNDFFGPFRSYQFDRSHKLGVDALEAALPVKPLGELRLINVLGYKPTSSIVQNPWESDNRMSPNETSSLLYAGNTYRGVYGALFAGRLFGDAVVGSALEGEIEDLCGYHLDFHQVVHSSVNHATPVQLALSVDRHLDDNTIAQAEVLYNGDTMVSEEERETLGVSDPYHPRPFQGRRYTAGVLSHTFVDLSELKGLFQNNWDDGSWLGTLYLKKPLTQNVDFTLALNVKGGEPPDNGVVRSEFGAYPHTLTLELVAYF